MPVYLGPEGRKIICPDKESFEEIRQKFFPEVPANQWKQQTKETSDALRQ